MRPGVGNKRRGKCGGEVGQPAYRQVTQSHTFQNDIDDAKVGVVHPAPNQTNPHQGENRRAVEDGAQDDRNLAAAVECKGKNQPE